MIDTRGRLFILISLRIHCSFQYFAAQKIFHTSDPMLHQHWLISFSFTQDPEFLEISKTFVINSVLNILVITFNLNERKIPTDL